MMNLHHLAVFHAVARTGSLSAASAELHVSQPALSREIRTFEARFGVTLFERHAQGMRLTEPGRLLAGYAEQLFRIEAEAAAAMSAVAQARRGRFTVGASNTVGTYVLPGVLAAFQRDMPDVDIAIHVDNTQHVVEGVLDMRFLIGFVEGHIHAEGVIERSFRTDEIVPVVAGSHSLAGAGDQSADAMAHETLLMRESGSGTREQVDERIRDTALAGARVLELTNTEALKQAAIHGGGIAWLPRIAIETELALGTLAIVGSESFQLTRALRIISRAGAYLPPAAEAFVDRLLPGEPAADTA